jgi:ABC-2 type transport system permease protein
MKRTGGGLGIVGKLTASLFLQDARSPAVLFWMLGFPAFLFVLFGFLFGKADFREGTFRVGVDRALEAPGGPFDLFLRRSFEGSSKVRLTWVDGQEGRTLLADGRLHALVTRSGDDRSFTVLVTEKDRPFGTVLSSVLEQASLDSARRLFRGRLPFEYNLEVLAVGGRRLTYLYFLFAGTLGLSVMLNCYFAIPQTIIGYRRMGFLKRFACTPLRRIHFTLSVVLERIGIGLAQIALLSAAAAGIFGLTFAATPLAFLPTFLVGTAAFAVTGFFLAGILATVEAAVAVALILAMLFMFTSGLFIPIELIPHPFSNLAALNPVWYFSRAVFSSMVLGRPLWDILPDLGALCVFFAAFLLLTMLTFRYERSP